jgi:hypothetical protein
MFTNRVLLEIVDSLRAYDILVNNLKCHITESMTSPLFNKKKNKQKGRGQQNNNHYQ